MTEREPVQSSRHTARAILTVMLVGLISIFALSTLPLLQPVGTDVTNKEIKESARLPVIAWCASWTMMLQRSRGWRAGRVAWTFGCLSLLLHIAIAFHLGHGWSHAAAWQHTQQVGGFGDGIYVNYVFALMWFADAVWALAAPRSYQTRSRWLHWSIHGFLAFVVINAAAVFAGQEMRESFLGWFVGFLLVHALAELVVRRRKARKARQKALERELEREREYDYRD
jgi:hypothetical protein